MTVSGILTLIDLAVIISDGSDFLSTSSQVDSVLDESTRIEPDCASLSSQSSFSKEDSGLGKYVHVLMVFYFSIHGNTVIPMHMSSKSVIGCVYPRFAINFENR